MARARKPVIAFFPEASFGAALNCVGIAQALKKRGAHPVFITHGGFSGIYSEYGFDEHYVTTATDLTSEESETYWEDFLGRHLPHFNLSPADQLDTYVGPVWQAIVDSAIAVEDGLAEALAKIGPDLIVLDNVIMFPAIANHGCPWVRIVSCAETEIADVRVPPYLSGLGAEEVADFGGFRGRYLKAVAGAHSRFNAFRRRKGLGGLAAGEFLELSPALTLLLSPSLVRHDRAAPLGAPDCVFLEGCVREESAYAVPRLPANDGPLVYLSFGSLGAMDVGFMQRLIRAVATVPARFLVNVGGAIGQYSNVPDNVHLQEWFPQPSVVAQCDLFIHHGGNNSFCEALYFGVPSLVIPYCWDGHDNARRAADCGAGQKLDRWNWSDEALRKAIATLLADTGMKTRLRQNAAMMQARPGTGVAADSILALLDRAT